jgi:hypothetical protein
MPLREDAMVKVLDFTDRLDGKKRKEQIKAYRAKVEAVQTVVQCSSCRLKCAMCGDHMHREDLACPPASASRELNLCETCQDEYQDFLEMRSGKSDRKVFWHNKEWMHLWASWLEYQKAMKDFRSSHEFKSLLTEPEE